MRSVVVLLIVSVVCLAQEPPKPCCFPEKFEGNMSDFIAGTVRRYYRSVVPMVSIGLSYDASAKKVASTLFTDGQPPLKNIVDFNAGKMYTIRGKNCTIQKIERPFKRYCIPSNAKYVGAFFQGAGSNKVNEEAWTIKGVGLYNIFTRSKCIPVRDLVYWRHGNEGYVRTMDYYNVTLGIKDPNVFKPPASCKGVEKEDHFFGEEYQLLDYLRMKHTS